MSVFHMSGNSRRSGISLLPRRPLHPPPTYRKNFSFLKSRGYVAGVKFYCGILVATESMVEPAGGTHKKSLCCCMEGEITGKKEHAPPNPASTCPRVRSHIVLSEKLVLRVG